MNAGIVYCILILLKNAKIETNVAEPMDAISEEPEAENVIDRMDAELVQKHEKLIEDYTKA